MQNGVMSGVPQSFSANIYGQDRATRSGTSPVITANGTSDGIVWALDVTEDRRFFMLTTPPT